MLEPYSASVANPDPWDPFVFGSPGSGYGAGSFYYQAIIIRKNPDSYGFVTSS
jgi:hypothetical protein